MVRKSDAEAGRNDEPLSGDSKDFLAQLSCRRVLPSERKRATPSDSGAGGAGVSSQIRRENGEPSYNIFGVKATSSWKGRPRKLLNESTS